VEGFASFTSKVRAVHSFTDTLTARASTSACLKIDRRRRARDDL